MTARNLEVCHCEFPDDLLYDEDFNVWAKLENTHVVLGITSIYSALAGKLASVKFKELGTIVQGHVIATIESSKFFGAVRTPLSGTLIEVNQNIANDPAMVNNYPYSNGWFAKVVFSSSEEQVRKSLNCPKTSIEKIELKIRELGVRCFKAFPDHEMWEIGVECAAVLSKLNDVMERCHVGDIVHVVSDDRFADIEISRWADETGQALLETRQEDQLMHFIVRKVK